VPPKAALPAMIARGASIPPATDSKPAAEPTSVPTSRMMAVQTARSEPRDRAGCADGVGQTGTPGVVAGGVLVLDMPPRFTDFKRRGNVVAGFPRYISPERLTCESAGLCRQEKPDNIEAWRGSTATP
jgi:hypothetical protein